MRCVLQRIKIQLETKFSCHVQSEAQKSRASGGWKEVSDVCQGSEKGEKPDQPRNARQRIRVILFYAFMEFKFYLKKIYLFGFLLLAK